MRMVGMMVAQSNVERKCEVMGLPILYKDNSKCMVSLTTNVCVPVIFQYSEMCVIVMGDQGV